MQYGLLSAQTALNCTTTLDINKYAIIFNWFRGQGENKTSLERNVQFESTRLSHSGQYTCEVYISAMDIRIERLVEFYVIGEEKSTTLYMSLVSSTFKAVYTEVTFLGIGWTVPISKPNCTTQVVPLGKTHACTCIGEPNAHANYAAYNYCPLLHAVPPRIFHESEYLKFSGNDRQEILVPFQSQSLHTDDTTVTWWKDGVPLTESDANIKMTRTLVSPPNSTANLTFIPTQRSHSGEYKVSVENRFRVIPRNLQYVDVCITVRVTGKCKSTELKLVMII